MNSQFRKFPSYDIFQRVGEDAGSRPYYVIETWRSIEGPRSRIARGGFQSVEHAQIWIDGNRDRTQEELPKVLLRRVCWLIDTLDDGQQSAYRHVQEALEDVIAGRLPLPEKKAQ